MTHYFCIAMGMADFSPTSQDYHTAEDETEMRAIIDAACAEFEKDDAEANFWNSPDRASVANAGHFPHRYAFRTPRDGEDNYSQRVCISRFSDCVLDVIGMTADEFERESSE